MFSVLKILFLPIKHNNKFRGSIAAQDWYDHLKKIMSTYFFKTNIEGSGGVSQIKPRLDAMEQRKDIERWHLDMNNPENLLEIETNKLSPEELKHIVREAGFEAEFTKAPQAR